MTELPKHPSNQELLERIVALERENARLTARINDLATQDHPDRAQPRRRSRPSGGFSQRVMTNLTASEKKAIENAADKLGLSKSNFMVLASKLAIEEIFGKSPERKKLARLAFFQAK